MTREELLNQYQGVVARYGTYSVSGSRITQRITADANPSMEGMESVSEFRLEGDVLILTSTDAGDKSELRFRRVKPCC